MLPFEDWQSDLDALIAAPAHHRLLFENDFVRVIETAIPPGETTPLHTHRWPGPIHLLSWSDLVRRNPDGAAIMDTRTRSYRPAVDTVSWSPALPPHTLKNVGTATFRAITTELKLL